MKNINQLFTDTLAIIKTWVKEQFATFEKEVDEKNKGLRQFFDEKLAELEKKIPEPINKKEFLKELVSDWKENPIALNLKGDLQDIINSDFGHEKIKTLIDERFGHAEQKLIEAIENIPAPKNGKDGENGIPGPQGEPGKSISVDDVRELLTDLVEQSVARIPLPKNGVDGTPGKDGESVSVEDTQKMIELAVKKHVAMIPTPENGKDGKDALQIEIQPGVDFEKSYSRGVYALHNGGLIRSYMQTNGKKGWETVINGLASIEQTQINERVIQIKLTLTDGTEEKSLFCVPAVIDRGVFKEDSAFAKGDGVTWAGSYWIAQKDNPQGKPGNSDDWRLAVKKGRDGK